MEGAVKGVWEVFPVLYIMLGVLFNVHQFLAVVRKKMRKENIFIFFIALMLMDCLALCIPLLNNWLTATLDINLRTEMQGGCQLHLWLSGVSLDVPPWLLVLLTYEKRAFLWYPVPADSQFSRATVRMVVTGLLVLFAIRHVDVVAYSLFDPPGNKSFSEPNQISVCGHHGGSAAIFLRLLTPWLDLLLRVASPFVCLATYNIFIFRKLQRENFCATRLMEKVGIVAPFWFYVGLVEARKTVRRTSFLTALILLCGLPYSCYCVMTSFQTADDPFRYMPVLWLVGNMFFYINYCCLYVIFAVQDHALLIALRDTWRNPLIKKRGTNVASLPPRIMPPPLQRCHFCRCGRYSGPLESSEHNMDSFPTLMGRHPMLRKDSGFLDSLMLATSLNSKATPKYQHKKHKEFLVPVM